MEEERRRLEQIRRRMLEDEDADIEFFAPPNPASLQASKSKEPQVVKDSSTAKVESPQPAATVVVSKAPEVQKAVKWFPPSSSYLKSNNNLLHLSPPVLFFIYVYIFKACLEEDCEAN